MSRLLLLAAIAAVVYWLFKSYRKQSPKKEDGTGPAEDMVRCVHCGVHIPKHESILADGEYFCSEAHRRLSADNKE